MEGLSFWSAQALQNLGCNGPLEVKYYNSSSEVIKGIFGEPTGVKFVGDDRVYFINPNDAIRSGSTDEAKKELINPKLKYEEIKEKPDKRKSDDHKRKSDDHKQKSDDHKQKSDDHKQKSDDYKREGMKKGGKSKPEGETHSAAAWVPRILGMPENSGFSFFNQLLGRISTIEMFLNKEHPSWQKLLGRRPTTTPTKPPSSLNNPDSDSDEIQYSKYALVYGDTTEINPSGIWIVEEFYNNDGV